MTKRKFLQISLLRQHRKCAETLRNGELKRYRELEEWLNLSTMDNTPESLSNRYHFHLTEAKMRHKEHNLLVEKGDKERGEEPWPIAIYLDHIRSAHNVGSIIRTCEALSLGTLYFSPQTPFIDHPQVQKTAMGAAEWVQGRVCTDLAELPRPLIALETSKEATELYAFPFPETFTLAIGNEEYGLSETILKQADFLVTIPMRGRKNSLNVANAFAIAAAEIQRQRECHVN